MDVFRDVLGGWFLMGGSWAIVLSFVAQYRLVRGDFNAEMELDRVRLALRSESETSIRLWQIAKKIELHRAIREVLTPEESVRLKRYSDAATAWGLAAGGSFFVATATSWQFIAFWLEY